MHVQIFIRLVGDSILGSKDYRAAGQKALKALIILLFRATPFSAKDCCAGRQADKTVIPKALVRCDLVAAG